MSELAAWLTRIVTFLPELIGLYEAVRKPNSDDQLNAALALVRKMKDQQAREEIGGP